MSDLIKCAKCGKETNRYSPTCEYCLKPLEHSTPKSSNEPDSKKDVPDTKVPQTIKEHGQVLHAELKNSFGRLKKCPFCAEEIQAEAIKCRYCGEIIKNPDKDTRKRKNLFLTFLAGMGILVIAALIFMGAATFMKGSTGIKCDNKLSSALKSDPVKADYVKKYITVTEIGTLEESNPGSSASTKYFYGTIRNAGDKTIIKLTLAINYFDKNGRCIAEGVISPILGTKDKPSSLKPAGSKDFRIPILNANPEWSGRFKEKVSDIEFL